MACGHPEKGNGAFRSRGRRGLQPGSRCLLGGAGKGVVTKEAWPPGGKKEARSREARPGLVILWGVRGP